MAHTTFILDAQAFNTSTHGMIQPRNIQMIQEEEEEVVNPQIFPQPGDTEEMLLDLIMASATDFPTFRDFMGYRFERSTKYSDSESDEPPLDYDSDSIGGHA